MISSLLPDFPNLVAFLSVSFFIAAVPGPAVLYIIARVLTDGKVSGLASAFGVAIGNLICMVGSVLGLSLVFASFDLAFHAVKTTGGIYIIYLGLMVLRSKPTNPDNINVESISTRIVFIRGFWIALLNPKTVLFFAAFLPQFTNPNNSLLAFQSLLLGSFFVVIALLIDFFYVYSASYLNPFLFGKSQRVQKYGNYLVAICFSVIGGFTILS